MSLQFGQVMAVALGICTAGMTLPAPAQDSAPAAFTPIGPGVIWQHKTVTTGPLNFNILKIDVSDPRITLETESAQDRLFAGEKVLASVIREAEPGRTNIVAAVNADFWTKTPRPFTPIGLLVADGMIYNMPSKKRSAFAFTENETPYIGKVTLQVSLKTGDDSLKIDRINSGLKSSTEIVLFTPPFGEVGPSKGKRYLLTMQQPEFLPNHPVSVTVSEIDSSTSTPLSAKTMVLHIPESKARHASRSINLHKPATLQAILPEVTGVVRSVCGGGPQILRNGQVPEKIADEGFPNDFETARHPRTALGFTKDKKTVILMTLDGRQPRRSIGATLSEMGKYMKEQGCWTAMNLDGGGSTSMVVGKKVVNKPSDLTGPRTVASSLLVVELVGAQ